LFTMVSGPQNLVLICRSVQFRNSAFEYSVGGSCICALTARVYLTTGSDERFGDRRKGGRGRPRIKIG